MNAVKLCRCGHTEEEHRRLVNGGAQCIGLVWDDAASQRVYCTCRAFEATGDQGRML